MYSVIEMLQKAKEIVSSDSAAFIGGTREQPEADDSFPVFFADVADSLSDARRRTISELKEKGVTILEKIPPPYEASSHEQTVVESVKASKLCVHLLDHLPGREIDGETDVSYPQKQFELAMNDADSQLVWVPRSLHFNTVKDEKHQAFLKSFEEKNFPRTNYEFIRSPAPNLTREILGAIERIKSQSAPISPDSAPAVFLDAHIKDLPQAIRLLNFLAENRIITFFNPLEDNPKKNIEELESRLQRVSTFIIIYGLVSREWVLERLKTVLHTIIVNNHAITTLGVYLAPSTKDPGSIQLNQRFIKLRMIDNSDKSVFDPRKLEPIVGGLMRGGAK